MANYFGTRPYHEKWPQNYKVLFTDGAEAGDLLHASPLSFPAETDTTTPAANASSTAWFNDELTPPPIDIDATRFALLVSAATALSPVKRNKEIGYMEAYFFRLCSCLFNFSASGYIVAEPTDTSDGAKWQPIRSYTLYQGFSNFFFLAT